MSRHRAKYRWRDRVRETPGFSAEWRRQALVSQARWLGKTFGVPDEEATWAFVVERIAFTLEAVNRHFYPLTPVSRVGAPGGQGCALEGGAGTTNPAIFYFRTPFEA